MINKDERHFRRCPRGLLKALLDTRRLRLVQIITETVQLAVVVGGRGIPVTTLLRSGRGVSHTSQS